VFRPERGEIEGDVSYLQTRQPRQRWPTSATQYDRVRAWAAPGLVRPVQLIRARRVDRGRPCAAGPSAGRWLLELKIGAFLWDEEVLSYSLFGCPGPDFRTDSDHLHEDALHEARRRIGRAAEARSCGNGCRVRSAMRSGDLFLHQGRCVRGPAVARISILSICPHIYYSKGPTIMVGLGAGGGDRELGAGSARIQ
jgi:hypothetical protein